MLRRPAMSSSVLPLRQCRTDVADLAGVEVEAVIELAVENEGPADAGAGEDAEDVLGAPWPRRAAIRRTCRCARRSR